jgi:hypothetical protein
VLSDAMNSYLPLARDSLGIAIGSRAQLTFRLTP